MQKIDQATAESLIDFSAGKAKLKQLAAQQLEGAVALHNRLALRRVAYLADEVGMGKTYIALGVAALMRRFNPSLRVLYLWGYTPAALAADDKCHPAALSTASSDR